MTTWSREMTDHADLEPGANYYKSRGMRVFNQHSEPIDLPDETPGPWQGAAIHGPRIPTSAVHRCEQGDESNA
jgi:hypothetical protein